MEGVTYSVHLGLSSISRIASSIETEIRSGQFDAGRSLDECPSLSSGVVAIAYPIHQFLDLHSQTKVTAGDKMGMNGIAISVRIGSRVLEEEMTYSTFASFAGVPLTCKHFVLSLLGLIARPLVTGVEEDDEEGAEDVLEEVDDVEEADEEDDEVTVPELSCLINSAARSA